MSRAVAVTGLGAIAPHGDEPGALFEALYSVACASAAAAIAEGAAAVQRGEIDVAIAGGSEALIVPGVVLAWQAMQTLATVAPDAAASAIKPFGADRSGFALGEGAAFLILEPTVRARGRGVRAHAQGDVVERDALAAVFGAARARHRRAEAGGGDPPLVRVRPRERRTAVHPHLTGEPR